METVRMSSKGQVVIPLDVRREIGADEGSVFVVMGSKDSVVLKKVKMPSKEELIKSFEKIAKEGANRAAKLGIKEEDVSEIVHKLRKSKR